MFSNVRLWRSIWSLCVIMACSSKCTLAAPAHLKKPLKRADWWWSSADTDPARIPLSLLRVSVAWKESCVNSTDYLAGHFCCSSWPAYSEIWSWRIAKIAQTTFINPQKIDYHTGVFAKDLLNLMNQCICWALSMSNYFNLQWFYSSSENWLSHWCFCERLSYWTNAFAEHFLCQITLILNTFLWLSIECFPSILEGNNEIQRF